MREKLIYVEKHKKWAAEIKQDNLPILRHLNDRFEVSAAYLEQSGISERNGKKQEFQIIRVYLKETK